MLRTIERLHFSNDPACGNVPKLLRIRPPPLSKNQKLTCGLTPLVAVFTDRYGDLQSESSSASREPFYCKRVKVAGFYPPGNRDQRKSKLSLNCTAHGLRKKEGSCLDQRD